MTHRTNGSDSSIESEHDYVSEQTRQGRTRRSASNSLLHAAHCASRSDQSYLITLLTVRRPVVSARGDLSPDNSEGTYLALCDHDVMMKKC